MKARERTAFHEAGHAVADIVLGFQVRDVTIIRRGNVLGSLQRTARDLRI